MEAKDGGLIFSNLAQWGAIFLVLVCQIDGTFQIFISARRHKGYCVHYQAGGKNPRNILSLLNQFSYL